MVNNLLEIMYIICGVICIITGIYAITDKNHKKPYGTGIFWIIFGITFIIGPVIPSYVIGILLLIMGLLTVTKSVTFGSQKNSEESYREKKSIKVGNRIFIPALSLGIVAFGVSQFTPLGGLVGIGVGSLVAVILTLLYTKENPKYVAYDSSRLLQQMGAAVILPQLLSALGSVFSRAGVGNVISDIFGGIVPEGSILFGIILYCIGMAVFTMIMGNAFAAFAVITAGIGFPFVIQLGGNPAVVGALGLTAGYCGTLLTPMAANFNMVPASILEMKNKTGVIFTQLPVAIVLLIIHIILMYFLAF